MRNLLRKKAQALMSDYYANPAALAALTSEGGGELRGEIRKGVAGLGDFAGNVYGPTAEQAVKKSGGGLLGGAIIGGSLLAATLLLAAAASNSERIRRANGGVDRSTAP